MGVALCTYVHSSIVDKGASSLKCGFMVKVKERLLITDLGKNATKSGRTVK